MTSAKQSFKSTPFFAVLVLVIIAMVSGVILSVLSDVLYVSDEERTNRALAKVYADDAGFDKMEINSAYESLEITYYNFKSKKEEKHTTKVTGVYKAKTDGTIIIEAQGALGWKGNPVIMMAVKADGVIEKVIVSTFNGDDKTTSISAKYLDASYKGKNVHDNQKFTIQAGAEGVDVSAGATAKTSMEAVASAVSMAAYYAHNSGVLTGGAN